MHVLKALVIGMGLLILTGSIVVVFTVVQRLGGSEEQPDDGFGTLGLGMAASCRVVDSVAAGAGLVVRYSGPAKDGCDVLQVIDPAAGRVLGTIEPHAAPAGARD